MGNRWYTDFDYITHIHNAGVEVRHLLHSVATGQEAVCASEIMCAPDEHTNLLCLYLKYNKCLFYCLSSINYY